MSNSAVVMAAMLVDKRITVSFRRELNSLFTYLFIHLFFHANSAKKIVFFCQHSRFVENHQSFKHTVRLYQLCSSLMSVLIYIDIHVCIECVENQVLLKIIDP